MEKIKNICYSICIKDFKDRFFERFKDLCNFFENSNVDNERKKEAVFYLEKSLSYFEINSIYSFSDKNIFLDKDISIDNTILEKLSKCGFLGLFIFAVAASENKKTENNNILEQFYFDLTGTAIIDVSKNILKDYFINIYMEESDNFFISNPFGVGFFGIEQREIYKFFELLDCDKIGLTINKSGVMNPNKSFIGFFAVSKNKIIVKNDCKNCVGSRSNCNFCKK